MDAEAEAVYVDILRSLQSSILNENVSRFNIGDSESNRTDGRTDEVICRGRFGPLWGLTQTNKIFSKAKPLKI